MKPLRLNKFRSNLQFLSWLAMQWLRNTLPSLAPRDPIDRIELQGNEDRVSYYCKLTESFVVRDGITIRDVPRFKKTGYNFDFYRLIAPFPSLRFHYLIGDIQYVPDKPTFVRCRPIGNDNANSVLLPLNTRRLFEVFPDPYQYSEKTPKIVWRGAAFQPHREEFLRQADRLSFCDVGATNTETPKVVNFLKPWMTPLEQMRYRFIFVIEGNDIASNIQWAMNSNSLVMMRKPRFESWYSEGRLQSNFHYLEIADDFSDLQEKYEWAMRNEDQCIQIVRNAQDYAKRFRDINTQYAIGRWVIERYASFSTSPPSPILVSAKLQ